MRVRNNKKLHFNNIEARVVGSDTAQLLKVITIPEGTPAAAIEVKTLSNKPYYKVLITQQLEGSSSEGTFQIPGLQFDMDKEEFERDWYKV